VTFDRFPDTASVNGLSLCAFGYHVLYLVSISSKIILICTCLYMRRVAERQLLRMVDPAQERAKVLRCSSLRAQPLKTRWCDCADRNIYCEAEVALARFS
jgi:hypothetical protein